MALFIITLPGRNLNSLNGTVIIDRRDAPPTPDPLFTSFGAVEVSLVADTEIFAALQTGVVDGIAVDTQSGISRMSSLLQTDLAIQTVDALGALGPETTISAPVTIPGTPGDDVLQATGSADHFDGGSGFDTADYLGGSAGVLADLINGGQSGDAAGDVFTSIEALRGTVFGDDLRGTNGGDLLNGAAGNDFLFARGGSDTVVGGDGNDTLVGSAGNDVLAGGAGNDRSSGGADNDRHVGGAGSDTMIGGGGNDTMLGGAGADTVFDGPGNSRLFGNAGNDRLIGAGGNDEINGGTGRDIMNGGAGVDRLAGGSGNDFMVGGAGADIFVFRDGMGSDTVGDHAIGTDRLFIAASLAGTSNPAVLAAAAQLVGQDVVFDFGGGNMLTLTGLGTTQGIEGDITLT